jgi:hypothetical protein
MNNEIIFDNIALIFLIIWIAYVGVKSSNNFKELLFVAIISSPIIIYILTNMGIIVWIR